MRKLIVLGILFCSGCGASFSFQPYQSTFSKDEITSAFKQADAKFSALAEAIARITPKEVKK